MANLDLRPLSLGEILDRTFSVYRANFLLFVGIAAVPQALVLLFNLGQTLLVAVPLNPLKPQSAATTFDAKIIGGWIFGAIFGLFVYLMAYVYSHGAAVNAVSDIYLGQSATIVGSFRKMRGHAGTLLGVLILNFLAVFAGFFVFIVGAFYAMCRLTVSVPAAILEDKEASACLSRSWDLTQDNVGRALAIIVLYAAISYALVGLFSAPFLFMIFWAAYQKSLAMVKFWTVLSNLGTFVGGTLATPVVTIASTVFYYDLRVRKEAFDLQMMIASVPAANPPASSTELASPLS
jgi:Membrane domain of glycerophosphoryl diester phosphodiesterase